MHIYNQFFGNTILLIIIINSMREKWQQKLKVKQKRNNKSKCFPAKNNKFINQKDFKFKKYAGFLIAKP